MSKDNIFFKKPDEENLLDNNGSMITIDLTTPSQGGNNKTQYVKAALLVLLVIILCALVPASMSYGQQRLSDEDVDFKQVLDYGILGALFGTGGSVTVAAIILFINYLAKCSEKNDNDSENVSLLSNSSGNSYSS